MKQITENIVYQLKNYFKKNNFTKAVIGVSGGVDSACTLKLGIQALGKNNIIALLLPEQGLSSDKNLIDARNLVQSEKVKYFEIPINKFLKNYENLTWGNSKIAQMNIRARIRMTLLYHLANTENALVLGTGNKTEILLGYGTKYGDFAIDLEPIGSLWKTEVFKLAKYLKLPEVFYTKAPTAELCQGQTDEEEIGSSYEVIDRILQNMENNQQQTDDFKIVEKILNRVQKNKHKTQMPQVF